MDLEPPAASQSSREGSLDASCSICLEQLTDHGERSIANLQCGHRFHLDCIGSAFNAKGAMQCPNCRKVEKGRWLYANGHRSSADFDLDAWVSEDFYDLSYSELPFGFQWCPFRGITQLASLFEEGESQLNSYHESLGNNATYGDHSSTSSSTHMCPYLTLHGYPHAMHATPPSNSADSVPENSAFPRHQNSLGGGQPSADMLNSHREREKMVRGVWGTTRAQLPRHENADTDGEQPEASSSSSTAEGEQSGPSSSSPEEWIKHNKEGKRILLEGEMRTAEASARQEYLASRERMILLERELQQKIGRETQLVQELEEYKTRETQLVQELEEYKTRAVAIEDKVQLLEARASLAEVKVEQLEVTLQELRTLLETVLDDPSNQPSVSETPSPSSGFFLSRAQSWKLFNFFRSGFATRSPSRLCDAPVGLDVALHKEQLSREDGILTRRIEKVSCKNL